LRGEGVDDVGQRPRGVKEGWIDGGGSAGGRFERGREGIIVIIIQLIHYSVTVESKDFKNGVKLRSIN